MRNMASSRNNPRFVPFRLHLGLTMVTCFISLWISNSAATAMMCPIVKAVLNEMEAVSISNTFVLCIFIYTCRFLNFSPIFLQFTKPRKRNQWRKASRWKVFFLLSMIQYGKHLIISFLVHHIRRQSQCPFILPLRMPQLLADVAL